MTTLDIVITSAATGAIIGVAFVFIWYAISWYRTKRWLRKNVRDWYNKHSYFTGGQVPPETGPTQIDCDVDYTEEK